MIISFKHKFIFIKNYKTASSSIESFIYPYLDNNCIVAPTEDNKGLNYYGNFESHDLIDNFEKNSADKYIKNNISFFAHMPAWLIKKRLLDISKSLNYDIFNNFFKFAVIRNPFDVIASAFFWRNSQENHLKETISLKKLIQEIKETKYKTHNVFNLNRIMDKKLENILCDKVIKYENLDYELISVFKKIGIPYEGNLNIFKKKNNLNYNYRSLYDEDDIEILQRIFKRELDLFHYKV